MDKSSGSCLFRLLFLIAVIAQQANAHWWSLARDPDLDKLKMGIVGMCDRVEGLSTNQIRLCKLYHPHMQHVKTGVQKAIQECQFQFKGDRWNCSTVQDVSVFGKVLKIGSREIAFAYAVASAGVTHAVSKACKDPLLKICGCGKDSRPEGLNPEWEWGGCSDDIETGYGFAREFVDAFERDNLSPRGGKAKGRKAMNLHNNEAGRLIVVHSKRTTCKCHGVSGTCSLKTCWNQVDDFRKIGNKIRQAHIGAVSMRVTNKGKLKPRRSRRRSSTSKATDLVFIESSPDYCNHNDRTGVPGTHGRECSVTSSGSDSCGVLCCGRGYVKKLVRISEKCNCKFQWCCTVKCEICHKRVTKYLCN